MAFELDHRLQTDCIVLGKRELCRVLLMNNAALPWFVLVPETSHLEVFDLPVEQQSLLWAEVGAVAEFLRAQFAIDKLNVGAIGNVVSQLHIHVVGRRHTDYCWPDVVWGQPQQAAYSDAEVGRIRGLAAANLFLEPAQ